MDAGPASCSLPREPATPIDASVALLAERANQLYTSDPGDLRKLCVTAGIKAVVIGCGHGRVSGRRAAATGVGAPGTSGVPMRRLKKSLAREMKYRGEALQFFGPGS